MPTQVQIENLDENALLTPPVNKEVTFTFPPVTDQNTQTSFSYEPTPETGNTEFTHETENTIQLNTEQEHGSNIIDDNAVEIFEVINSDEESDSESEEDEIFDSNSVPVNIENLVGHRPSSIKIMESRGPLIGRNDNHVIFVNSTGQPVDGGAEEYWKANKLPEYEDIIPERAKINTVGSKNLISLPIRVDDRTLVDSDNVKNCIRSLLDVITETGIKSFSMRKTEYIDDIPWSYIQKQMIKFLRDIPLTITICKNLIQTPDEENRVHLINEYHCSTMGGHKGITKTYNRLRTNYHWPNMKKDIQLFIQQCRECQLKKLTRVKIRQPMIITDTPGAAFDKISLDIVGPLPITQKGNAYILTIQDLLTKYSVAIPLKETNSMAIADAFVKHFICIYGAPKALLTDQGSNFMTSLIKNLARKFGIKQYKTTAYHPQSQGSIERSHHVLIEYLKTQITEETEWDEYINLSMYSYNTSVHESTNYTPFQLVYGRIPRLPTSYNIPEEITEPTYYEYCNVPVIPQIN